MPDEIRLTRRAFIQMTATATALSAFSYMSVNPALADTTPPAQAEQVATKRRVPVGLL